MRTFAAFTVAGVAGIAMFKLLTVLIIPILGLFIGLMAMTVKLAVIAAVVFFLVSLFRKKRHEEHA